MFVVRCRYGGVQVAESSVEVLKQADIIFKAGTLFTARKRKQSRVLPFQSLATVVSMRRYL